MAMYNLFKLSINLPNLIATFSKRPVFKGLGISGFVSATIGKRKIVEIIFERIRKSMFPYSREAKNSTKSAESNADHLIWIDLEMTGLEPETCHIMEAACIITDGQLNIIAEGPDLIIHQPQHILDTMDNWCFTHHNQSGLTEASLKSKISLQDAENQLMDFLLKYTKQGKCPLAGNSVSLDRLFVKKYMPRLEKHLHYRIVDVSSVKELCRRWYPVEFAKIATKKFNHRALSDIAESIEELRIYRNKFFKSEMGETAGALAWC